MIQDNTDILLDDEDNILIANGDLVIGKSYWQEVKNIVRLIPGQLKETPMLGPNLVRMINSNVSELELKTVLKRHLEADGKDYDDIKDKLSLKRNG